jgi:hypothetical protein
MTGLAAQLAGQPLPDPEPQTIQPPAGFILANGSRCSQNLLARNRLKMRLGSVADHE